MKDIEVRSFDIELRGEDNRHIEGYGSIFNSRSVDLGGFAEIIAEGAFDGVIERSDVKCYLEHDANRGILARSRNGKGSLTLELDEKGLKYSFDAPHTNLGDEVVEGLKRGDYSQSSFAFTVESESWTKEEDGHYLRTINKIGGLYDVSIVANPAYEGTEVALRSLDAFKETEKPQEEPVEETPVVEEKVEDVQPIEEENNEPEVVEEPKVEENRNNNNKKINHMSNFSLIKAINDVVNNRNINEDALSVIEMGATEMRKSGLSYSGQIQLPVQEVRAEGDAPAALPTDGGIVATVATQGAEVVATDKLNILAPLYGKSILAEATVLTGLVGNVSIPVYSGTTVGWKGEMVDADNGKGDFDSKELSPKRLTAYVDISKQFLVQDSVGAEEMLRADIVNALKAKLEQTIFGDAAGDATKPAGIFNGADAEELDYTKAVNFEADVTDFGGEKKWILSPSAKAAAKQTTISGEKSDLRLLCENNEINGYPVVTSSNVADLCYAFGDFKELVVAQWGALDIVVDPYTLATKNAIRLVINAFFDATVRRDGAIVVGKLA